MSALPHKWPTTRRFRSWPSKCPTWSRPWPRTRKSARPTAPLSMIALNPAKRIASRRVKNFRELLHLLRNSWLLLLIRWRLWLENTQTAWNSQENWNLHVRPKSVVWPCRSLSWRPKLQHSRRPSSRWMLKLPLWHHNLALRSRFSQSSSRLLPIRLN